ncbi:hypothetical protein C0Q70_06437 [Pomacea canaliculata]|uniref:G-protein coupled receptors family 1 profile domain-containing protein n=2 Tax=Pomacea canaliculata TaxID=400727 RepID=A0A2T7PP01_POMCA|nr:hypothetical protein C0Q70_06437 [Pomacea canaliculata]
MNYSSDSADPDSSHADDDLCHAADKVVKWMWSTIAPFIIIIGLLGNLLVIIVFERLHFRKSSTLLHMFVLAFNDSVILCLGPVRYWTKEVFQFDLATISDFGCRLNFFVLYTSLDFSAWILVSVSVERVVSVHKPLHARIWFTVNRALIRLVIIFVLLCGINMHFFFTNGLVSSFNSTSSDNNTGINTTTTATTDDSQRCDSLPEFSVFNNYYFVWIDLFFDSLFPFVLMALSNCFIVKSLRESKRNRPRTTTRRALQQHIGRGHRVEETSMSQDGFESEDQAVPQPNGHAVGEVYESGAYEQSRSSDGDDAFENEREAVTSDVRGSEGVSSSGHSAAPEQTLEDALSRGGNHIRMEADVHARNDMVLDRGGDLHTGRPTTNVRLTRQHEPLAKPVPVISWGVTRMLVLVTTIFLVTTLPNSIYYIIDTFLYDYSATCSRTNAIMNMVKVVTNLLQYSNYGINFWLYSSRSNRFRMEVKYMLGMVGSR